jgi:hypothetical protein
LWSAGGLVDVAGSVGGKTHLAGAVVRFDGTATGDLQAAGADVEIGSDAVVNGALSVGGVSVTVDGRIVGPVHLSGAAVVFNGNAGGSVTLDADEIIIGPSAVIAGDLILQSHADASIDANAKISGQTRRMPSERWWTIPPWTWWLAGALFVAGGAFLAGVLLVVAARGAFAEGVEKASTRPFSSGLIGLVVLIVLPLVAALFFATVLGAWVGFALLLVLPMLFLAGHAVVAACIGAWIIDRTGAPRGAGRLLLFLLVGAIILGLIWLIPWGGGIIMGLAGLVGIGAWARTVGRRAYAPRPQAV